MLTPQRSIYVLLHKLTLCVYRTLFKKAHAVVGKSQVPRTPMRELSFHCGNAQRAWLSVSGFGVRVQDFGCEISGREFRV